MDFGIGIFDFSCAFLIGVEMVRVLRWGGESLMHELCFL